MAALFASDMDGGWVLASLLLRGGRFPGKHKGATRSRFTEPKRGPAVNPLAPFGFLTKAGPGR